MLAASISGRKKVRQKELQRSLLSSSHLRSLKPHHVHVSPLARSFLASLSQSRGGWHRSKRGGREGEVFDERKAI